MKHTVAFGWPLINNGSHNNQPKTDVRDGGEYGEDVRRLGGTGGRYHYFGGVRSGEANKN